MDYTIRYSGICGSDILRLDMGQPLIGLGHEVVAQNETGWYALNPLVTCSQCGYCQAGKTRFCTQLQSLGKDGKGGFSGGVVSLPEANAFLLETSHPETYVLADSLACVLHGLSLLSEPTSEMLVIGDGVIAELVCTMLAQRDIFTVQVVKRRRSKEDIKSRHVITQEEVAPTKYRTAILCVGGVSPDIINRTLDALAFSGTLLVMGAFHKLDEGLNIKALLTKEITFIGSYSFEPAHFSQAIQEISKREALYLRYITDILPSDQLEEAVVRHRTSENRLKVAVKF